MLRTLEPSRKTYNKLDSFHARRSSRLVNVHAHIIGVGISCKRPGRVYHREGVRGMMLHKGILLVDKLGEQY